MFLPFSPHYNDRQSNLPPWLCQSLRSFSRLGSLPVSRVAKCFSELGSWVQSLHSHLRVVLYTVVYTEVGLRLVSVTTSNNLATDTTRNGTDWHLLWGGHTGLGSSQFWLRALELRAEEAKWQKSTTTVFLHYGAFTCWLEPLALPLCLSLSP